MIETDFSEDRARIEYVMKNAILPSGAVGYETTARLAQDLKTKNVDMLDRIRQGKGKITKTLARRINARFPDCPAEWLLTGQDAPPEPPLFLPPDAYENRWWLEEGTDAELYTAGIPGRWELQRSFRCSCREPGRWKAQACEQVPGWEFGENYVTRCIGCMRIESSRYRYNEMAKRLVTAKYGNRSVTKLTDTEMILLDWSGMGCGYVVKEIYLRTDGIPEKGPMLEISHHRISMP